MISSSTFVTLALIPFTFGQSTNNNDVRIELAAIKVHFTNAGIVPSLLASFDPSALLSVAFGGNGVAPGTSLSRDRQSYKLFVILLMSMSLQRSNPHLAFPSRLWIRPLISALKNLLWPWSMLVL